MCTKKQYTFALCNHTTWCESQCDTNMKRVLGDSTSEDYPPPCVPVTEILVGGEEPTKLLGKCVACRRAEAKAEEKKVEEKKKKAEEKKAKKEAEEKAKKDAEEAEEAAAGGEGDGSAEDAIRKLRHSVLAIVSGEEFANAVSGIGGAFGGSGEAGASGVAGASGGGGGGGGSSGAGGSAGTGYPGADDMFGDLEVSSSDESDESDESAAGARIVFPFGRG